MSNEEDKLRAPFRFRIVIDAWGPSREVAQRNLEAALDNVHAPTSELAFGGHAGCPGVAAHNRWPEVSEELRALRELEAAVVRTGIT